MPFFYFFRFKVHNTVILLVSVHKINLISNADVTFPFKIKMFQPFVAVAAQVIRCQVIGNNRVIQAAMGNANID